MNPKIYIIILNWNGGIDTIECIEYLLKVDYDNYEIILIDNGSTDGSFEKIEEQYDIHVIKNDKNLGFVEGNNIGIKYALRKKAEYILLLNNDTIVDKDFLKELLNGMLQDEKIAVIGPKILNYYQKNILESAGGAISLNLSKNIAIGYGDADEGQFDFDREVDFVSGCVFFVRAKIFEEIDFFNKKYFAYYEDMDMCHKIRQFGYKLKYVYKAKVWHKVSAASGGYKSPNAIYWSTRNRFLFVLNCGSIRNKVIFFLYFFLIYFPGFILTNLFLKKIAHVKAFLFGFLSLFSGKYKYAKEFPYNIAIDTSPISKSKAGVGYYTAELIKSLNKQKTCNRFCFFKYIVSEKSYLKIFNVGMRLFWEQIWIPLKLLSNRVDLAHFPAFVCPIIKTSKYIVTIHDLAFMIYPKMFLPVYRWYLKIFVPLSLKRADLIIADSYHTKKDIIKIFNINEKKIHVIHVGVSDSFKQIKDERLKNNVIKKYNINSKYILHVGTLEPRKNIIGLVKAYKLFLDSNENGCDFKLVIVGVKGWYYSDLFKLVRELNLEDNIIDTGYIEEEDLPVLYSVASLFAYVSFYEGFGLPPVEAMACGCPVLASNVSSIPEVVGDAGYLVDPYNIDEIAKGIKEVLFDEELRQKMIVSGLKQSYKFDWEKCSKETLDYYDKLLV